MKPHAGTRTAVRWGLAFLVLAWTVIFVVSAFTVIRFSSSGPTADGSLGMDYEAFVAAGQLVADGQVDLLYEPESEVFSSMADVGFVYPPWFAVLMVPWTVLPFGVGFALWSLLGLVSLAAPLRVAGVFDIRLFVGALVAMPGALAIALGQSSFFLVAGLALVLAPNVTNGAAGGLVLGISSWKPHLLGGFAMLAVADPRRWLRTTLVGAATAIALLAVSAILLPGSVRAWVEFIGGSVDTLASAILESSLPGFIGLLVGATGAWRYLVVAIVGTAALVAVLRLLRRTSAGRWEQVTLASCVWLLVVPHVVVYDVLLLLVPLGGLYGTRYRRDVVVAGTGLAFATTLGPWITLMQVRTMGWAVDLTTLGLIAFTLIAARWVTAARPIWTDATRDAGVDVG